MTDLARLQRADPICTGLRGSMWVLSPCVTFHGETALRRDVKVFRLFGSSGGRLRLCFRPRHDNGSATISCSPRRAPDQTALLMRYGSSRRDAYQRTQEENAMTSQMTNAETWQNTSNPNSMDVSAALGTMAAEAYVNHVPTMTGGSRALQNSAVLPRPLHRQWPSDTTITPISRTSDDNQIVDESDRFHHDRIVDCSCPASRQLAAGSRSRPWSSPASRMASWRANIYYWDQASVLVQAGLIDPVGLPVAARNRGQAQGPKPPSNTLIKAGRRGPDACVTRLNRDTTRVL